MPSSERPLTKRFERALAYAARLHAAQFRKGTARPYVGHLLGVASIVSLYYNRQGTGDYKCCTTVYSPPTRGYNFDTDFLTPACLPPRTPMFRTVNTIGFTEYVLPQ